MRTAISHHKNGFTLTEVLIAMVIMGVIAVFTIPKVINSAKNSDSENWKRAVKQTVSEVESAYSQYRLNNGGNLPSTFTLGDVTQYLNFVSRDTVNSIDGTTCYGAAISCSGASNRCYRMKNGSVLHWHNNEDFNSTAATNALKFRIDPDGKVTGPAGQDPGKAVVIYLYYGSGKLRSRPQLDANTYGGGWGPEAVNSTCDPNWWSWN